MSATFYEPSQHSDLVDMDELFQHYDPIDVTGDGNCGLYVFMLAHVNKKAATSAEAKKLISVYSIKKTQKETVQL